MRFLVTESGLFPKMGIGVVFISESIFLRKKIDRVTYVRFNRS